MKHLLIYAAAFSLFTSSVFAEEGEVTFSVHNKTSHTIKRLLVSEDGKEYNEFDIGKGIAPGKEVTLVWSKEAHDQDCNQFIKAIFSDGEESEPAKHDFCEDEVALEFED